MKRIFSLFLAILLVLFCLAGCALFEEDVEPASTTAAETTREKIVFFGDIDWDHGVSLHFPYDGVGDVFARARPKRLLNIKHWEYETGSGPLFFTVEMEVVEDYYQTLPAGEVFYIDIVFDDHRRVTKYGTVVQEGEGVKIELFDPAAAKATFVTREPSQNRSYAIKEPENKDPAFLMADNPLWDAICAADSYLFHLYIGVIYDNNGEPSFDKTEPYPALEMRGFYPVKDGVVSFAYLNSFFKEVDIYREEALHFKYYVKDTFPPQYEDPILTQDMPVAEAEENLRELYQRWKNGTVYEFVPSDYIITK